MANISLEEKIKRFLLLDFGYGYGYTSDTGYGSNVIEEDGYGWGSSSGDGSGLGNGDGDGWNWNWNRSNGLKKFKSNPVYYIDNLPTVILSVHFNLAKGFVINEDLTTTVCYIAKGDNLFAHGETVKKAQSALQEKIFNTLSVDEKIKVFRTEFKDFNKKYPAKVFYDWHHKLTGSCEFGRNQFCKNHKINIETDQYSVKEFVKLCANDFGGSIIAKILDDDKK